MRIFYLVMVSFIFFSCEKEDIIPIKETEFEEQVTITTKVSQFTISLESTGLNQNQIGDYAHHVSPMTHYTNNGVEYILLSANMNPSIPLVQLKKSNNVWGYLKSYPEVSMGVGRNYEFTKDGIVYADHGWEGEPRPFGDLYYGRFNGDNINWTKISVGNGKSFYHSVSSGDINGDGLNDVVGIHMGIKGHEWGDVFHTFTQTSNGTFDEDRTIVDHGNYNRYNSNGAILVQDLNNDGKPEIIKASYGGIKTETRYSFLIYSYNNSKSKYEVVSEPKNLGIYNNYNIGTTSVKSSDFDGDGDIDLALAFEGEFNGVQIFENKGNFQFEPKDLLQFTSQELEFREFNLLDYDKDGDMDIVLNPFHDGNMFRKSDKSGILLHHLFWRNDKTKFNKLTNEINANGVSPDFLKGYIVNGIFKFVGMKSDLGNKQIGVVEIEINL